jgi:hypothetical protein
MARERPPLPSLQSSPSQQDLRFPSTDPFADRHRAINFQDDGSAYESTISLPQEYGRRVDSEEKLPLTQQHDFSGGFYPPG